MWLTWVLVFLTFVIGLISGIIIGNTYTRNKAKYIHVGTIRLDTSTGDPYLFLELEKNGMDKIHTEKEVLLDVKIEDYISQQ